MTVEELVPDGLWEEIAPLLPAPPPRPRGGRRRVPYRNMVAGIVYVLRTGVPGGMSQPESWAAAVG